MKMLKQWMMVLGLCVAMGTPVLAADESAPDALVRSVTEDVLAIVKKDRDIQSGNARKVHELVDAKVLPHFDFNRMTQLAVGPSWRLASAEQQQSLVREFRTLLVRIYSSSLSKIRKDQTIDIKPVRMRPGDDDVTVRTLIRQQGNQPVSIDYSLRKTSAGWKAYDVVVGGVSIVTNYRNEFDATAQKSGVDGLIRLLLDKNRRGDVSKPAAKS